jgi:hypothetical protein
MAASAHGGPCVENWTESQIESAERLIGCQNVRPRNGDIHWNHLFHNSSTKPGSALIEIRKEIAFEGQAKRQACTERWTVKENP